MTLNAQQRNAKRQRDEVTERVEGAMASMQLEIDSLRKKGLKVKRLSRSAVLALAGKVDKNTLRQPYHAELSKAVDAFVERNTLAKPKSLSDPKSMTDTHDLGHYAQLLGAAQIMRDEARKEANELKARVDALEAENRSLRGELLRCPQQPPEGCCAHEKNVRAVTGNATSVRPASR